MRRVVVIFFLLGISLLYGQAQNKPGEKPKLVVIISVEHMRADYLNRYWNTFQNGGFKRLLNDGALFENARVDVHNLKASTVVPTLSTGTYPSQHGIVADQWYRQLSKEKVEAINDGDCLTLGSDSDRGNVSANQLKKLTLGDVLKQQSNFQSKVFSVALNANTSVLSAGHAANGAFWYDVTNGNMITSSYYMDQFPDWVMEFNNKKMADVYLQKEWDLLLPIESYKAGFEDNYLLENGFWNRWNTFPYQLEAISKKQEYPYELLKATPYGNKLIKDFAVQLIDQQKLGKDEYPDLLNIGFSTLDYANKWFNPSSVEIQEVYLRLDQEISSLLRYFDQSFGKDNYLVVLTSGSTSDYPVRVLKDEFNFDAGEFSPQSAMALLRSYLNALYGVEDWVVMYNEEQIYLNHRLIENKGKSLNEMRDAVASFLNQFTGVKAAVPAHVIESGNLNNPRFKSLEQSYCVQRSGDVMILLDQGWYPSYRYHQVDYSTHNRIPLIFYGLFVKHGVHDDSAEIIDVVPTVSKLLHILPPDDANGKILNVTF